MLSYMYYVKSLPPVMYVHEIKHEAHGQGANKVQELLY